MLAGRGQRYRQLGVSQDTLGCVLVSKSSLQTSLGSTACPEQDHRALWPLCGLRSWWAVGGRWGEAMNWGPMMMRLGISSRKLVHSLEVSGSCLPWREGNCCILKM